MWLSSCVFACNTVNVLTFFAGLSVMAVHSQLCKKIRDTYSELQIISTSLMYRIYRNINRIFSTELYAKIWEQTRPILGGATYIPVRLIFRQIRYCILVSFPGFQAPRTLQATKRLGLGLGTRLTTYATCTIMYILEYDDYVKITLLTARQRDSRDGWK